MGHHRQLAEKVAAAIDTFANLVSADSPAAMDALSRARVVLVQSVNSYIAYFGECISAASHHPKADLWRKEYNTVFELRRSYSDHITRYTADAIKAEWESYKVNCQRLIRAMRQHLQQVAAWDAID